MHVETAGAGGVQTGTCGLVLVVGEELHIVFVLTWTIVTTLGPAAVSDGTAAECVCGNTVAIGCLF